MASSGFFNYVESTGLIVPDTQGLLTQVQSEFINAFGTSLILAPNTPQGALIAGETLARSRTLQISASTGNQLNPDYAGGVFLDSIGALTNSKRDSSQFTIVPLVLTGVSGTIITSGAIVQDTNGNMYQTLETVTLLGSGIFTNVTGQALASGAIIVQPKTVTTIVTNTLGWETVNNLVAQTFVGSTTQSDPQFRLFRKSTLAVQGNSVTQAITSGINAVPGVNNLFFQQNINGFPVTINGVNMAASSIYVCVDGGDPTMIATAMNKYKSGGCNYNNAIQYLGMGTPVGPFTIPNVTLTGPFTLSTATVTANSNTITYTGSPSGTIFKGQTVNGVGIPFGATIESVGSGTFTISVAATISSMPVLTLGGSPVLTTVGTLTNVYIGQTVAGTGIPTGALVQSFISGTSITLNFPVTSSATASETISMGGTPFITNLYTTFTQTGTLTGTTTVSTGVTVTSGSKVVAMTSTAGVFVGQALTGSGIAPNAIVLSYIPNVSLLMSLPAVGNASAITLGGSIVVTVSSTQGMFLGQGVTGTGVAPGSFIVDIFSNTAFTLSFAATVSGSPVLTFAAPNITVGGEVSDGGVQIPLGSTVVEISGTTLQISNPVTGSTQEFIEVFAGIPQNIPITDPYSNQTINVLFDQPAIVPIGVIAYVGTNTSLQDIITTVQTAIMNWSLGESTGDPGLRVGTNVSAFNIAGAIKEANASIYVNDVLISVLPSIPTSSDTIEISPWQLAQIQTSSITVIQV